MMAEPSSNRQKGEENIESFDNTDRISSLPDSVLCHILSFLPTKTCVETSLLSRRWRHVWENIQVLEFCDYSHDFYNEFELFKRFAVFVNGVLALRRSRDIRKIRLSCDHTHDDMFYANSVATWVRASIGPKLEELHLTLYSIDEHGFVMPSSLFTCTNLISLSLCGRINVNLLNSSEVYLPLLKTLQLNIDSVDSLNVVLSGCPNLDALEVSFAPKFVSNICMPHSLKSLKFSIENEVETFLEIDTPGLKHLSITQRTACTRFSVGNFPNVVDVILDVYSDEEPAHTLLNLLRAVFRASSLELHRATTKWLLRTPVLDFPEFGNLFHLNLVLPYFNSNFLLNVLSKCHAVHILVIKSENEPSLLQSWLQPTSVPCCLVSGLGFIHIEGFNGFPDELAFVKYLLRKGLLLKMITIGVDVFMDIRKKYQIIRQLCALPRISNECQLKFD